MKLSPRKTTSLNDVLHSSRLNAFAIIVAFTGAWEAIVQLGIVPRYILPPFSNVAQTLWQETVNGQLVLQTSRSLLNLVEALCLSIILSAIIVFLCQKSKWFSSVFNTISITLNSIPSMALMPLIIMWFGIDKVAILVLVIHSVLWTLTIHLNDSLHAIPKAYSDFANNIGLSTTRRLLDIYLPAVLPEIVAASKIAWGRAWRSLISAEIVFGAIGSVGGLGYFINVNRINGNMAEVMAGITVIALVGIFVDRLIFRRLQLSMEKSGIVHG